MREIFQSDEFARQFADLEVRTGRMREFLKGLELKTQLGEVPNGPLDPLHFERAVTNLLTNAIKYTDEGHVEIATEILPVVAQSPWVPNIGFLVLLTWRLMRPEIWPIWAAFSFSASADLSVWTPADAENGPADARMSKLEPAP